MRSLHWRQFCIWKYFRRSRSAECNYRLITLSSTNQNRVIVQSIWLYVKYIWHLLWTWKYMYELRLKDQGMKLHRWIFFSWGGKVIFICTLSLLEMVEERRFYISSFHQWMLYPGIRGYLRIRGDIPDTGYSYTADWPCVYSQIVGRPNLSTVLRQSFCEA